MAAQQNWVLLTRYGDDKKNERKTNMMVVSRNLRKSLVVHSNSKSRDGVSREKRDASYTKALWILRETVTPLMTSAGGDFDVLITFQTENEPGSDRIQIRRTFRYRVGYTGNTDDCFKEFVGYSNVNSGILAFFLYFFRTEFYHGHTRRARITFRIVPN